MKFLIVTGFLGAGKTTVLMELLHALVDSSTSSSEVKVALIENEVGKVSIDDKLLASTGTEVTNLFSGCVCCTLTTSLAETVMRIEREMNPEWIVLETTGMAKPSSIVDTISRVVDAECKTLVVVDPSRWLRIREPLGHILEAQLDGARYVIVNKCDIAAEEAITETLADATRIAPDAQIYRHSSELPLPAELVEALWA